MLDKKEKVFGVFKSAEEINKAAINLRAEGDLDNIYILAKENGIEKEIVDAFNHNELEFICDEITAAIGKIDVESEGLNLQEIMLDWIDYIKTQINKSPEMARKVMNPNKSVRCCIAEILQWSFKNSYEIPEDIMKAAEIKTKCRLGIPGMTTATRIIRKYYE